MILSKAISIRRARRERFQLFLRLSARASERTRPEGTAPTRARRPTSASPSAGSVRRMRCGRTRRPFRRWRRSRTTSPSTQSGRDVPNGRIARLRGRPRKAGPPLSQLTSVFSRRVGGKECYQQGPERHLSPSRPKGSDAPEEGGPDSGEGLSVGVTGFRIVSPPVR